MKKIIIYIALGLTLCCCQPRQFQSHSEAVEYYTQKKKKEKRFVEDWKAMGIFSLIVFAIGKRMADRR